ncbi:MAG: hypothetical protein QM658_16095 [Gordonia sp. (in: high G+C Gram-positive bacteria)]
MSAAISFFFENFTLTFALVGLIIAAVICAVHRRRGHAAWATFLNWFLLCGIGITYAWNGVVHTVFGDLAAERIGWENNGFQAEVGFASLGVGLVGVYAFSRRAPFSLKLAALIAPASFLWGAAGTHIADIVETGNMSPDNAGVVLYTDIFVPVVGFVLWGIAYVTRTRVATVDAGFFTATEVLDNRN